MMIKRFKPLFVLLLISLVFGCATKNEDVSTGYTTLKYRYESTSSDDAQNAEVGKQVVKVAQKTIGTPYVLGGSKPGGFDCSGLVMWAYNRVGVKLPRTAREQSTVGEKIVNPEEMRAGDIVAFRHPKRGYHTGIYVGDGKFIHSPRTRSHVKINSLEDKYFKNTLLGARRVKFDCTDTVLVDASAQFENYVNTDRQVKPSAKKFRKFVRKTKNTKQTITKKGKQATRAVAAKTSSRKIALRKPVVKNASKSLAQATKTTKTSATAKVAAKKSGQKAVSLLNKKAR